MNIKKRIVNKVLDYAMTHTNEIDEMITEAIDRKVDSAFCKEVLDIEIDHKVECQLNDMDYWNMDIGFELEEIIRDDAYEMTCNEVINYARRNESYIACEVENAVSNYLGETTCREIISEGIKEVVEDTADSFEVAHDLNEQLEEIISMIEE